MLGHDRTKLDQIVSRPPESTPEPESNAENTVQIRAFNAHVRADFSNDPTRYTSCAPAIARVRAPIAASLRCNTPIPLPRFRSEEVSMLDDATKSKGRLAAPRGGLVQRRRDGCRSRPTRSEVRPRLPHHGQAPAEMHRRICCQGCLFVQRQPRSGVRASSLLRCHQRYPCGFATAPGPRRSGSTAPFWRSNNWGRRAPDSAHVKPSRAGLSRHRHRLQRPSIFDIRSWPSSSLSPPSYLCSRRAVSSLGLCRADSDSHARAPFRFERACARLRRAEGLEVGHEDLVVHDAGGALEKRMPRPPGRQPTPTTSAHTRNTHRPTLGLMSLIGRPWGTQRAPLGGAMGSNWGATGRHWGAMGGPRGATGAPFGAPMQPSAQHCGGTRAQLGRDCRGAGASQVDRGGRPKNSARAPLFTQRSGTPLRRCGSGVARDAARAPFGVPFGHAARPHAAGARLPIRAHAPRAWCAPPTPRADIAPSRARAARPRGARATRARAHLCACLRAHAPPPPCHARRTPSVRARPLARSRATPDRPPMELPGADPPALLKWASFVPWRGAPPRHKNGAKCAREQIGSPRLWPDVRSDLGKVCPESAKSGRTWPDCGPILADLGPKLVKLSPRSIGCAQTYPK